VLTIGGAGLPPAPPARKSVVGRVAAVRLSVASNPAVWSANASQGVSGRPVRSGPLSQTLAVPAVQFWTAGPGDGHRKPADTPATFL